MIKNADALEERGVDITELEDLYEEELVKLDSGRLSKRRRRRRIIWELDSALYPNQLRRLGSV